MQPSTIRKTTCLLIYFFLFIAAAVLTALAPAGEKTVNYPEDEILGFSFMDKIPGLWNGPVSTDTPAGDFDAWYVDFRPVSASQVSQYSRVDANTINYISFFIVKHDGKLKIAMRTEGVFMDQGCVTYEFLDQADEEKGYYRFSDFQAGDSRACTEFIFKDDKLTMLTYTNKFNKQEKLTVHSEWKATLGDRKAADMAREHFDYPKPEMVKDFSDVFRNMSESIYFTFENDPYPVSPQPYVGSVTVNIDIDEGLKVKKKHELFLLLTTESLFDGLKYDPENNKYFSKYVYLPVGTESYTIINVHPGTYYLYSYNDVNGDNYHKSGDYMSSDLNNVIEVPPEENVEVNTVIDFVIP